MLQVRRTAAVLASKERWASSATDRMKGLRGSPPLESGEALVIPRARQVHSFGMNFPIDVIFCDQNWNVLHVVRMLKRSRITRWVRGGYYAIELPGGGAGDVARSDRIDYSLSDR